MERFAALRRPQPPPLCAVAELAWLWRPFKRPNRVRVSLKRLLKGRWLLTAALLCSACTVAGGPVAESSAVLAAQSRVATLAPSPTLASPVPATQAVQTATSAPSPTAAPTQRAIPPVVATSVPTPVATKQPTPLPAFATFGNGMQVVGVDIAPGTYRTRVGPGPNCSWQRLGPGGQVLASEYPRGPTIVTIAPTDRSFFSSSCPTWTQDLSPLKSPTSQFGDGTFFVGPEVAPGTWRASDGGRGCFWSRLSNFLSGDGMGIDRSGIIASGAVRSGEAVVTISATDKGLNSDGCTWLKS